MQEQLIQFETAKLAKEKGFNYTVYGMYRGQDTYWTSDGIKCICVFDEELNDWEDEVERVYKWLTPRPTQSLLQKWLREVHNIYVYAQPTSLGDHAVFIKDSYDKILKGNSYSYEKSFTCTYTYEEALEIGLQEALKLI